MRRAAYLLALVAAMLSALPSQGKTDSTVGFGYGGKQEDRRKGWGDDAGPNKENKKGYEFKFEQTHDNKKGHDLAGNTKEGDKKGGWWVHGEHGGEWSTGVGGEKEKGNNNGSIGGKIGGGYSGSIDVGAQTGRVGSDRWNAQARVVGKLKGEVKAALEAALKNDDDFAGLVAEIVAEGTVSAEISGTAAFTVGGVPISVTGKLEGHWGLSAHASVKVGYDKKTGKFVVQESVGASLGFGASETVTFEMDAESFCREMGLDEEWDEFVKKLNGGQGAPGPLDNPDPDPGDGGGGGMCPAPSRPIGLTPLQAY